MDRGLTGGPVGKRVRLQRPFLGAGLGVGGFRIRS